MAKYINLLKICSITLFVLGIINVMCVGALYFVFDTTGQIIKNDGISVFAINVIGIIVILDVLASIAVVDNLKDDIKNALGEIAIKNINSQVEIEKVVIYLNTECDGKTQKSMITIKGKDVNIRPRGTIKSWWSNLSNDTRAIITSLFTSLLVMSPIIFIFIASIINEIKAGGN